MFWIKIENVEGSYYVIDKEKSSQDIINVFGNLKFPILEYTKIQMMNEAKEKDYYDIMLETWFCFNPVNGRPCGICNPCTYAIEEGMGFRLGTKACIRNRKLKIRKFCVNILKKFGIYNCLKTIIKRENVGGV